MSEDTWAEVDAKTRFYLERRQQIEEWAALGPSADEVRDHVYELVVDEMGTLAQHKGLHLHDCRTGPSGRYRTLGFIALGRADELERDGTPAAAVTVAWSKWSFPDRHDAVSVGIRVARSAEDWRLTHGRIMEATRNLRRERLDQTSDWWPLWEYVSIANTLAWWDDPQLFITPVREATEHHLNTFGPVVDEVLRARGSQQ